MVAPINFIEELRLHCVGNIEEDATSVNLILTAQEFIDKIMHDPQGSELLSLWLRGEWRICKNLGLCSVTEGQHIMVPRWNNLMAHLRIVNSI